MCLSDDELRANLAGRLSPAIAERLEAHLRTCPRCAHRDALLRLAPGTTQTEAASPRAGHRAQVDRSGDLLDLPSDGLGLLPTIRRLPSGDEAAQPGGPAPDQHPRGSVLGRYVILDRVGSGGMGVVYAAYDPDLDRRVALKVLRADVLGSSSANELRLRLLREAQGMARLSHPNVITVHDVGVVGDEVFVAMEYVDGATLAEWRQQKPRSWSQVLTVFLQAGQGLAAAHDAGLVHRDFKPENVLVSVGGQVRVLDFGLVHAQTEAQATQQTTELRATPTPASGPMRRRITAPGTLLGTPAYMAPEQLHGRPTDPRSDQFSFCVALYEAVYGERPFVGETAAALLAEIEAGRVREEPSGTQVPSPLRRILKQGLAADPRQRFRSMQALLARLGRRRTSLRRRSLLAGLVALGASLVVGAWVLWSSDAVNPCAQVARRLEGVWDPRVREAARQAFLATGKPYAGRSWAEVERVVNSYARSWIAQRKAACEAARARGSQGSDELLGQRMQCLGRRLTDLQALTQLYQHADSDIVERGLSAALALPKLERCTQLQAIGNRPATPVDQALSESVRARLAAARARLEAGKFSDGLKLARAALEGATLAQDRPLQAEALVLTGNLLFRTGDARGAVERMREAVLIAEAAREDATSSRAWIELVGMGAYLARHAEADEWAAHARASLERLGGDDELYGHLHNNLGVLAWSKGLYEDAVLEHRLALEIRERALGAEHPLVAKSLSNLGIALRAQGRYAEALDSFRRAEAIEARAFASEHPYVAETLNNLGNLLKDTGKHDEAIAYLTRALEVKERAYGPEHLSVAVGLNNLSMALSEVGRTTEAIELQRRAIAIKERTVGREHPSLANSLTNLAQLHRDLGEAEEALTLSRRALALKSRLLRADHPDLAFDLTGIGQALLVQGRPEEAIAPLEHAVRIREQAGVEPAHLAESRFALAQALRGAGKDLRRAKDLARRAREAFHSAGAAELEREDEVRRWLEQLGS